LLLFVIVVFIGFLVCLLVNLLLLGVVVVVVVGLVGWLLLINCHWLLLNICVFIKFCTHCCGLDQIWCTSQLPVLVVPEKN